MHPRSADLVKNNSQIYRIYSRRLANPAEQDIFIASAGKLTAFLSDRRAYYAQAQESIVEILEVACNSLKNLAPRVFSKPGAMDKSLIPPDKVPLFNAFDKLANSVTPFIYRFTDKPLNNRLLSLLSSIGISLPSATTDLTSPDTPTQTSATPSTGNLAYPQRRVASPIGTALSGSVVASGQPVSPVPTSTSAQAAPIEVMDNDDDDAVIRSAPDHQILQSPASESLRRSPSVQELAPGDVVNLVPEEPKPSSRLPAPLLSKSSLHAQPSSSVSVPRVAPPSHKIPTRPSVTSPSASPKFTSQDWNPQPIPPSLASTGQVEVVQVPQSIPPQVPVQAPASAPHVAPSSAQQKQKPPPRRQSSGLDFFQLDLQVAREKKLRAAALAAEAQKSGSTTQASPEPVTASPTSTTASGLQNTLTHPLAVTTSAHTSAPILSESSTTSLPQPARTPAPSLVHRDLRQASTRNGTSGGSPRKLRIADRAPAPAPEPGSSSAPIVIDEDEGPMLTPADEPMDVDAPTQPLLKMENTVTPLDLQDESKGDTRNDKPPEPDQVVSRPLASEHEPSPTGPLRIDVISTQSHSSPSTAGPLSSFAAPAPAIPAPRSLASVSDKPSDVRLQQATDGKEQGREVEDSAESLGISSTDILPVATYIDSKSSAFSANSPHTVVGVMVAPEGKDAQLIPPVPAMTATTAVENESSPAIHDADEHNPQSDMAKPHDTEEYEATTSVAEGSPATGKHGRSPTPTDGDIRRVLSRKQSNAERQQDLPSVVLQPEVIGSTSPATTIPGTLQREKEGHSETAVDPSSLLRQAVSQMASFSNGKTSVSMLAVPSTGLHPSTESLSDMDISRTSITPPPIAVLVTHSGVSSATNSSLGSRSISPSSGKRLSEAGPESVKADELEDEMMDELAPLFGKEMRVICMDRAWDAPGEFTWNFTLPQVDWDRVSQWAQAPEILDSDISRARCITLACYSKLELEPYATQDGLSREQWFENVKPVPWTNLPRNLWALINDKTTAVFPPYVSPDDLFDVSPFLQSGDNKITFTQIDSMEGYVLVLHGHYPTPGQLVPLHARWDQERNFLKQLQWFARPFTIDDGHKAC